jgi:hypothetical protein
MTLQHHTLIPGGHTADQIARREATLVRIRDLLAKKPHSRVDLAIALGIPSGTVYGYLCQMQEVDEVYQLERTDEKGRKLWAAEGGKATPRGVVEHQKRAWIVPARQMGMQRDALVAALFGPARGGVA